MVTGVFLGMSVFSLSVFLSHARAYVQEPGTSSPSVMYQPSPVINNSGQYDYPYTRDSRELRGTETTNASGEYTGRTGTSGTVTGTQTSRTGTTIPYGTGNVQGADRIPPTAPTNLLVGQADGQNAVLLWWSASRDTFGVQKYIVYRDSVKLAETTMTKYLDKSVVIGGRYTYFIVAQDAAGNVSGRSKVSAISFPIVTKTTPGTVSGIRNTVPTTTSGGANVNSGGTSGVTPPISGSNLDRSGGQTQGTGTRIDGSGVISPTKETASGTSRNMYGDDAKKSVAIVSHGYPNVSATLLGSVVTKNGTRGSWVEQKMGNEKESIVQKSDSPTLSPAASINSAADQDNDGLSDAEEVYRGTDVKKGDTDGDGFSDGDEVKSGYDPLKYSIDDKGDRITFQSPKAAPLTNGTQTGTLSRLPTASTPGYVVNKAERISYEGRKPMVQLSGIATPNSWVTVYLYSDPIIAIVETDASGNWTYGFDSELENGNHEAYVTATDNEGRILVQSEPLTFVKTAEAIMPAPKSVAAEQQVQSPEEEGLSEMSMFLVTTISLLTVLSLGGIMAYYLVKRNARV